MALGNSKPKSGGYGYKSMKDQFAKADAINKQLNLQHGHEAGFKVVMGSMTVKQAKSTYCK